MEKEKVIYWAGFFDGKGHVELAYAKPTKADRLGHYSFQVWINQWTKEPDAVFAELLANFGGRAIPSDKGSWPNNARWYISGIKGREFLETILPYLRIERRVAELGIDLHKRMEQFRGKSLTSSEVEARDSILKEYFSFLQGNNPKRILSLGQEYR